MVCVDAMTQEQEKVNEKIINEEYKIWKKISPFLYDVVFTRALDWPSLTVEWLPESTVNEKGHYTTYSLLLGTHTSRAEQDYLKIVDLDMPLPDFKTQVEQSRESPPLPNRMRIRQKIDHEGEVNKARHCPLDPRLIASLAPSGETLIFDREALPDFSSDQSCRPLHRLKYHTKESWGLSWSPFTKGQLLTGSEDATIALWDLASPSKPKDVLTHHSAIVNDVQYSVKNANLFASASEDASMKVYDLRLVKDPVMTFEEIHSRAFNSLSFNHFNEYIIATGCADDTVGLWDIRNTTKAVYSLSGHASDVSHVAWSPHDESVLASAGYDRRINLWDLSLIDTPQTAEEEQEGPPELVFIHGGHTNRISDLSWHPTIPWTLASCSEDNICQVWKAATAVVEREVEELEEL